MSDKLLIKPAVRELIENRLDSVASEFGVEILFACESGSRAWGFPSPDSDYDIRFIYAHSVEWYVSVEEERDVIEKPIEQHPLGEIDLGGWDIRKVLRQVQKSNPVIWEWLQSPIIYRVQSSAIIDTLRNGIDALFSPISACHHYLAICRGMMKGELQGETVKIKKYFYMLRPILAAAWIERFKTVPPMEFAPLLTLLDDQVEIRCMIDELLTQKQQTDERIPIVRIAGIDDFLEKEMVRLMQKVSDLPSVKSKKCDLNPLFRHLIGFEPTRQTR